MTAPRSHTLGSPEDGRFENGLWLWGAVWVLFSVAAVVIRGVRWDEAVEHAQIVLRTIPYPPGHPQFAFYRNSFSGQTYLAALFYHIFAGDLVLCAIRNVDFLAAGVIPVFLLTARGARSVLVGCAAVALILLEVTVQFSCNYPVLVWPIYYGYGVIGTGCALLVVYLVVARHYRMGALLLGLMPAVHLGQTPPVLVFMAVCVLWTRPPRSEVLRILGWGAAGLASCAVFWALKQPFHVAPPDLGPYSAAGDPEGLWRSFVFQWDRHRSLPAGEGHVALAAAVLFFLGAVLRPGTRPLLFWIGGYTCVVAAIVWGTMTVQYLLGDRTPFLLISWMPYRLMNHAPPLLVAVLAIAAASGARRNAGMACLAAALALGACRPLWRVVLGVERYNHYIETGGYVLYVLMGVAAVMYLQDWHPASSGKKIWLILAGAAWAVLALHFQFAAVCVVLGAALAVAAIRAVPEHCPSGTHIRRDDGAGENGGMRFVLATACVAALALVVHEQWNTRTVLPRSDFDREVSVYLRSQGEVDALVAASPDELALQARLGHPVLAEPAMPVSVINYMPALGPVVAQIYRDLYGIHLDQPRGGPEDNSMDRWKRIWPQRTPAEWRRLRETYGLRYVIAPDDVPLTLPVALRGATQNLYKIPAGPSTPE